MENRSEKAVVGVFATRHDAQQAIHQLTEAGYGADNIGFASRDNTEAAGDVPVEDIKEMQEDASSGAASGVAAGGLLGGALGAGAALLIPGVGPAVAAGILAAGAAAGAFAGGLYGPFINMGATEEEAQYYDREFQSGASIVTVYPGTRGEEEARQIFRANSARNIEHD